MPVSQPANFNLQEFSDAGLLLFGGRLYTYAYGTTAQKTAYTDPAGAVPQTYTADGAGGQYIALNARGELPAPLYLAPGAYDIALKRADGSTVWTRRADPTGDGAVALAAGTGSGLVGWLQAGIGAVVRWVQDKLRERVSVRDFGAIGDGVTDDTAAFQKTAAYLKSKGGGRGYIPGGYVYLLSAPTQTSNNVTFYGDGDSSRLLVNADIEVFNSDTATPSTAVFRAEFRDFFIDNTVTAARTKYDIHLQNPCICKFDGVHIASGHIDSAYSATNVGGIFLDKPAASTSPCYMNRIKDCWIQNNSIYFKNVTDSSVTGGYVWGHVRQFAIRFSGGGANAVEKMEGIICSKFNGGIWLDGTGINQMRIHGNEFDGNPALDTGTGVYAPASTISTSITGNTFWGCDKHGIDITDPIGLTVTGNAFWKNNAADNFYDDIRITGATFQPNGNVVSGNTHVIDDARVNKGYAIREVNAGFNPVSNTYTGNGVQGAYQNPAILILLVATATGNMGVGAQDVATLQGTSLLLGTSGVHKNISADIAASGTLDLPVNTGLFLGQPGGASGFLNVTCTRSNFATQSRRQVYAVSFIGATANFTQVGANVDGSGGGPTFTLTMSSAGVIRFTDTSATPLSVAMTFNGVKQ